MAEDELVSDNVPRMGDAAATAMAMQADASLPPDSRANLREQTRLARLQSENLIEQNAFEISHLRWRRFADRVRGAGSAILMLLGMLVVAVIAAAIWSASHDNGLVVESFSVPPGLAEQGQTGTVVAQHVLDRIIAMQAGTQSLRAANSYRTNWGDDLKVQIPDTGVSLGEAYRILVNWIGRPTRITGEVVGSEREFAVTARAGAGAGATFRGNDLEALLDKAAERIFGQTQPYRYGIYGRDVESKGVLLALANSNAPAVERAWAYSGLLFVENETRVAEQFGFEAVTLNPDLLLAHNNLSAVAGRLGHSEFAYRELVTGLKQLDADAGSELDQRVLGNMHSILSEEAIRELRGDLAADQSNLRARSLAFLMRDLALSHDPAAARRIVIAPQPSGNRSTANRQILLEISARGDIDIESNDWKAAKIAKFREADLKGPHFADPLEMWGEAMMLSNRSDLALAKFEEANTYAPNWGRLHLKWGEGLFYAGNRNEAKKQFVLTSVIDLSAPEISERAKNRRRI